MRYQELEIYKMDFAEISKKNLHGIEEMFVLLIPLVFTDKNVQLVYQLSLNLEKIKGTIKKGWIELTTKIITKEICPAC